MRTKTSFFLLIVALAYLVSCHEPDLGQLYVLDSSFNRGDSEESPQPMVSLRDFFSALNDSKKIWKTLKEENNNTYSYLLQSSELYGWNPNIHQTIIEIDHGASAGYTVIPLHGSISDKEKKNIPIAKTIDQLYEECENKIIPNLTSKDYFNLNFFANGVLATCSFGRCGLADSEDQGVKLMAMAFGRTKTFSQQNYEKEKRLSVDCGK